jgi:ATP-dependent Clp protease ATP-binding subunit ClpC
LELQKVTHRLRGRNIELVLDDKAKDYLVQKGYDPVYGARPMRRAVEQFLEDPLAEDILKGKFTDNIPIQVTLEGDKLVFNQTQPAAGAGALSS